MLGLFTEIFESISKHKLRTLLTAFSVAWGILMLVLLLAVGNGLSNGVKHSFRDDAINSIWVYPRTTSIPYKGLPEGRKVRFTMEDFDLIKQEIDGIEHLGLRYNVPVTFNLSYGTKTAAFDVRATNEGHRFIEMTQLIAGRFINASDVKGYRKVAVIGKPIAEFLFGEENPIGHFFNASGVQYKVVGMFEDEGNDGENKMIYIPYTTAQRTYGGFNNINQIMFTTGDATLAETQVMAEKTRSLLAEKHGFDPNDRRALWIRNNFESFQRFNNIIVFVKAFVSFIGLMTLVAGVVGVGNILVITVKERTKEFGIRKALGATPWSITGMVLLESIFITVVSGYSGLVVGLGLIQLVNTYSPEMGYVRYPDIDLSIGLWALLALVVTGAMAGLIPSWRAARIKPIIALREE